MATLVLSTVGQALGGPLGAAVGAMVGQSIDQALLGPGPRQGPRLDDLRVQTSRYGTEIVRLYGTMRVAGSVVWATDLIEDEALSGGTKGEAEVQLYRYRASLAVALSSRKACSVGRIWADGKLIRGAQGDFKVALGAFRFHDGSEDQAVDPLIASIEGLDAPAYRGTALAVFEDLDLSEFGNRIPMLSFEVVADDQPVDVGSLVAEVAGARTMGPVATIGGYALSGRDKGSALGGLIELFGLSLVEQAGETLIVRREGSEATRHLTTDRMGCAVDAEARAPIERQRRARTTMPERMTLGYHDPARDYQAGLAEAQSGAAGGSVMGLELPMVAVARDVRGWIETALADCWSDAERLRVSLPPDAIDFTPGDRVTVDGVGGSWQICSVELKRWVVDIELRRRVAQCASLPAEAGRATTSPDAPLKPTMLSIHELGLGESGEIEILLAGSSTGSWKPVPVSLMVNGSSLGDVLLRHPAIMGRTLNSEWLPWSPLADMGSRLEVELADPGALLLSADDDALAMGANLAIVGDELIQFGKATALGGGRYRLSKLLRGRRGTEWACDHPADGEAFALVDSNRLLRRTIDPAMVGAVLTAIPRGLADDGVARAEREISGESLRPMAPVHLQGGWSGTTLRLSWTGRSKSHLTWSAQGKGPARFEVSVKDEAGGLCWEGAVEGSAVELPVTLLPEAGPVGIEVRTMENGLPSRPASRVFARIEE